MTQSLKSSITSKSKREKQCEYEYDRREKCSIVEAPSSAKTNVIGTVPAVNSCTACNEIVIDGSKATKDPKERRGYDAQRPCDFEAGRPLGLTSPSLEPFWLLCCNFSPHLGLSRVDEVAKGARGRAASVLCSSDRQLAVFNVPAEFTTMDGRRHQEAESKAIGQPEANSGGSWKPDASVVNNDNLKLVHSELGGNVVCEDVDVVDAATDLDFVALSFKQEQRCCTGIGTSGPNRSYFSPLIPPLLISPSVINIIPSSSLAVTAMEPVSGR
ncbi:hypothetical protein Nepgr_033304 [Nepenthes gracilis]|uniref:Uncharacterized protein n=1 Tax=Nepenthes gracilis TaxID=150966 RepID=A0AAD3TLU4_NEPGR|nr:hypothetical protein Nepgr_033304 [Nepenthes gracilis]